MSLRVIYFYILDKILKKTLDLSFKIEIEKENFQGKSFNF